MVDSKERDSEDSFFDKFKRFKINNVPEKKSSETIDQALLNQLAYNEKIQIAITSIIASASLTVSKFIIAIYTNSLGLLSEGMHSGLDVLAALMTLYAIRISRKPPDPEHNYGYAKFESLTSLGAVLLLFIVAGWIFYEGLERIFFKQVVPEITVFSFGILIVSIVVDYGRSRALYKVAGKYGSQAIEADALHFRVDMLTSFVVLVGLAIVYFLGIPNADAYSAITVAGLIVYTSLGLGRRTLDVLLDKAPKGIQGQIHESITGFEGIKKAHSIRVRKVGKDTFVDLHIEVPRIFTHDKAHRIATSVEYKIKNEILPNSDVVVHVDAVEDYLTETIKDKIRLISEDFPSIKNVHSIYLSNIVVNETSDRSKNNETGENSLQLLHLYLDVQMDDKLSFKIAHGVVDDFEKKIKEEVQNIKRITTHIETDLDIESSVGREEMADQTFLERIKKMALSIEGVSDCDEISLVYVKNELHITLTIKINPLSIKSQDRSSDSIPSSSSNPDDSLSVEKAHDISTQVQNLLLENTNAARVIVHAEPA
ncbi:Ferrous-iron efflux pump FieF [Candidatus Nitrosocosmicus oleophilus]|uniref:Ferrous-iron efflux pump FieF n=1 Tax=Candidatus Nitrosocosmicus oleophilus TaxID=1353260 RepID=A0A654M4E3_9ARCH|nr:cation diffusion facilitator family transporter [Candidatus Nitrosocosmicus oleophilus]ALI37593.1 Ferrous-iron efflux pump FieF [Candidatus Nitrosocosmicus oleophilus]